MELSRRDLLGGIKVGERTRQPMRREMHHQGWMDAADEGPIRLLCIPKSSVLQTRPLLISSVLRVVQCEACTTAQVQETCGLCLRHARTWRRWNPTDPRRWIIEVTKTPTKLSPKARGCLPTWTLPDPKSFSGSGYIGTQLNLMVHGQCFEEGSVSTL